MVDMRMDRRLQGRIDAADVVQDAFVEVAQRLNDYLKELKLPLLLWLRLVVGERLMKLHRHHLGADA
jgi:RNA polymerase sigma-70 factor (ECF subfamily)